MTPRPSFDLDSFNDLHCADSMSTAWSTWLIKQRKSYSKRRPNGPPAGRFEELARVVGDGAIDWHHTLAKRRTHATTRGES